jgi:hypothetical protein
MAGAINVKPLAIASHAAPAPDVHPWPGIDLSRRQLDHSRKHVRFCVRIHAGPRRLAAEMRLGEIPFAADIEQVFYPVEVEKECIAAAACEKV